MTGIAVGDVLMEAWELYSRFFRRFVGTAAAVFVLLDLLEAIADDARRRGPALALVWSVVSVLASIVGLLWIQAALIGAVEDVRKGEVATPIGQLYRRTLAHLGPLLGAAVTVGLSVLFAGLFAGLLGLLGLILFLAPLLWLVTRWVLVAPVIVLERRPALEALSRSTQLVRGHGWRVLGVVLLTLVLGLVAHSALVVIFAFLPRFLQFWIGGLLADSLVTPFIALTWTVTYYRLVERAPSARAAV